jgi:hypothetical protein
MEKIFNPDNVPITRKEIYSTIMEYSIPEDYYFESCGTSYGNHIFGTMNLTNYYVIKKRKNETDINKDSE